MEKKSVLIGVSECNYQETEREEQCLNCKEND